MTARLALVTAWAPAPSPACSTARSGPLPALHVTGRTVLGGPINEYRAAAW